MSSTGTATSTWINIKLFLLPRISWLIHLLYFIAIIWVLSMASIGGAYIWVSGFRDILDTTGLSKFLISQVVKDKLAENEYSNSTIFLKYIMIKHIILITIIVGIRIIIFGKFLGR